MKRAIAFGSFDILHPGHISYLKAASKYGKLTVVVARDRSIQKLKGRKPFMDENSRLEIISSLKFVDRAVLGNKIRKWNDTFGMLLKVRPDVVVIGYDQRVDMDYLKKFLKENGMGPRIVRTKAYKSARYKSSKLRELLEG